MAILPDLGTASLYALAAFLVVLGILVIFVETVRSSRLAVVLSLLLVAAIGLTLVEEIGVALILVGIAAAFVANHVFEWLTAR